MAFAPRNNPSRRGDRSGRMEPGRRNPGGRSPINQSTHQPMNQPVYPERGAYDNSYNPYMIQEDSRENHQDYGQGRQKNGSRSNQAMKYIAIVVSAVIGVLFLVKAGQVIIQGLGPAIEAFQAAISNIFSRFVSALIGAVMIYFFAITLLGRYLSAKAKRMIIPVCVILLLLYTVAPALSTAIGELILMLLGISILLVVFR